MGTHTYSDEEMNNHCSEVDSDQTRYVLRAAMESLHIEEKWLGYLKDEQIHFLFKTYFLAAIQEGMPEEYLESFLNCTDLDTLVNEKNALILNKSDQGNMILKTEVLQERVEILQNENEFYKNQVKALQEMYSDCIPLTLMNQYKVLAKERQDLAEEKLSFATQKATAQNQAEKDREVAVPGQKKLSYFERRRRMQCMTKREALLEKCMNDLKYDMDHLELLQEAYGRMESLEVLEHLVQAQEKKEDVEETRKWLERRRGVLERWKKSQSNE